MKRQALVLLLLVTLFTACNWFRYTPEIGNQLADHFRQKMFRSFDTAAYNPVFEQVFLKMKPAIKNPVQLRKWYTSHGNEPMLITRFYANGELDSLRTFISRAPEHGLDPRAFGLQTLDSLLNKLNGQQFRKLEEAYPVVAELELAAANSYLSYHNALSFGCINPKNYLSRYNISNQRPDSLTLSEAMNVTALHKQLVKDQPGSASYKALQKALIHPANADKRELILVNLERLRWKQPALGENYVFVNIPDFSLTWFSGKDTLSYMRVCVGGRRENGYNEKIATWLKTRKLEDQPSNHETPMLVSKLKSIQVNPVWNIPVSIGKSEIYYMVLKDRNYLNKNNIKVYYKDKLIEEPDTIQWHRYAREKLPFRFKQGSGDGNALGKFKFIFDSSSSIYLHDTNNKGAFGYRNRAISHGCIRIEKPLEFAEKLLNDKYAFDKLRMEVNLPPIDTTKMAQYRKLIAKRNDSTKKFTLGPKWFSVKTDVPLIITYQTAWVQNDILQVREDVYGQDALLLNAMKKYTAVR